MYRAGLYFSDASRSFAPRHRWDRLQFWRRDAGGLRGQPPLRWGRRHHSGWARTTPAPHGPATERATDLRYARSGASGEAKATSSLRAKVRRRFLRYAVRCEAPPVARAVAAAASDGSWSPVVRSTRAHHW